MATLNDLIPLSSANFSIADAVQQGRDNKQLFAARDRAADAETMALEDAKAAREAQAIQAEQQKRRIVEFGSVVNGVKQLYPLLPQKMEDVPAFQQALGARIQEIEGRGGDSSDSRMILELAQKGDFNTIRQNFDNILHMDQQLRAGELGVEALMPKQPEAFTLSEGQRRYGPDGELIAEGAEKPAAGFTLGEGQVRYDAQGNRVASGPAKAVPGADPGEALKTRLQTEEGLRKEFNTLTKDFQAVSDSYARVLKSAQDPSAAGDLAMVFNFMKMLDPGSTVREGEFANAAASAGMPDRIVAAAKRIDSGELLAPDQRQDFLKVASEMHNAQLGQAQKIAAEYRRIAEDAGVKADNVIATILGRSDAQTASPQSDISDGQTAVNPQTGQRIVLKGGRWVDAQTGEPIG